MNMSPTVASLLWLGLCLAQIAAAGAQSLPSMGSCPSSSSEQKGTSMAAAAGSYSCRYSQGLHWSELSAPLQLLVTGHFSKPSLRGAPSTVVAARDTVTFLCQALRSYHNPKFMFSLLKAGVPHPVQHQSPEGDVANFTLPSVKAEDAGNYSCIYSVGERSSSPSDALQLKVTAQDYTVGNIVRIALAGLVLIILGVFLAEAWHSQQRS